jgi:peptide chain release factor 1
MNEVWESILTDYEEAQEAMQDPKIASDPEMIKELGIKLADLEPKASLIYIYQQNLLAIEENQKLLQDPEYAELAQEEIDRLEQENEELISKINKLLASSDPNDPKNAIVEIRSGTGGDEAALFAGELTEMLLRFAENRGFNVEILEKNAPDTGGIKDISLVIKGKGVYGLLKYESGVHRVQRVPKTESKGRLHTSAASIFITPEVEASEFAIPENELKFETFRSSGPGGQSVNTTDSAVRITHIPTGVSVSCQDEKSQHKNKARALKVLRSRLAEQHAQEQEDAENAERRSAIKTGDRSEKIRTWNFPQDRMTDHRLSKSFFGIKKFLEGNLDEIIETFKTYNEENNN